MNAHTPEVVIVPTPGLGNSTYLVGAGDEAFDGLRRQLALWTFEELEGVRRQALWWEGEPVDAIMMAILREEFERTMALVGCNAVEKLDRSYLNVRD